MAGWISECVNTMFRTDTRSPEVRAAQGCFSSAELTEMQQRFDSIAGAGQKLDVRGLQQAFGIESMDTKLAARVHAAVCRGAADRGATFDDVVIAKAQCCKGADEGAESFCFRVLDPGSRGAVPLPDVRSTLGLVVAWATSSESATTEAVDAMLTEGSSADVGGAEAASNGMTLAGFRQWAKNRAPSFVRTVRAMVCGGTGGVACPQLEGGSGASLLQPPLAWALSGALAPKQTEDWELLYSSNQHGQSYNSLLMRAAGRGPALVVVRDKQGHVFGGFASVPLQKSGQYYGDFHSFVFSLLPEFRIHRPSGVNSNFQWTGIGFSQLPNGIAFGGQVNHFGLLVDGTLDHGHSRAAATYNSPSLSASPVFDVDVVEVWRVEPPPADDEDGGAAAGRRSVLDKTKEDQEFLGLAGRQMHSAAERD